jgi:hypothetical protein
VGPRAGLDAEVRGKILSCVGYLVTTLRKRKWQEKHNNNVKSISLLALLLSDLAQNHYILSIFSGQ